MGETTPPPVTPDRPVSCRWTADEDGVWHTACDHAFVLNEGDPVENELAFCGYCGKPLVAMAYTDGR